MICLVRTWRRPSRERWRQRDHIFGDALRPTEADEPAEVKLTAEQLFGPDSTAPAAEETPLNAAQIFGEEPGATEPPAEETPKP